MKKFCTILLLAFCFLGIQTHQNTADAQMVYISHYMDGTYYADTSSAVMLRYTDDPYDSNVWAINVIGNLDNGRQNVTTYYFIHGKGKGRYYWTLNPNYNNQYYWHAIDFNNKSHANAMILGAYWASHDVLF